MSFYFIIGFIRMRTKQPMKDDTAAKWLRMLRYFRCEFVSSVRMDARGRERSIFSSEF